MNESTLWPPAFFSQCMSSESARVGALGIEAQVELICRHRLLPLAVRDRSLSPDLRARLDERYLRARVADQARLSSQQATLQRLGLLLAPGSWIGIKGVDYGVRLYGDPLLRPMDDIDLLVREADFRAQVEQMLAHGFVRRAPGNCLEESFEDRETGVVVDLYRALIQTQRVAIDYEQLWKQSTLCAGTPMLSLAHALTAHALVMANLQYITHYRKYLDLWLLCRDPSVVVTAIQCASRWRMRRALYGSLRMLTLLLPDVAREPWFSELERQVPQSERHWLQRWVLPAMATPTYPGRLVAVWRKFNLIDDWSQRMYFISAHLKYTVGRELTHGPVSGG